MNRTRKTRGGRQIKSWATKARKKQRGGFLGLLIAGLTALEMSAGAAATTAAVAAPVITGAISGAASYGMTKALGGGKRRINRVRIRTRRRIRH